jgi:hypothetical protein
VFGNDPRAAADPESLGLGFALMKLVQKIKRLFRKQPLTDERIAALAEAESTRQQVLQQATEIRSRPGYRQAPP